MGLHKFKSKAIRFNGFTDGIVVPTGQFKETGVNLLRPAYAGTTETTISHATKIGRLHLPTESNPLNRILGPFTVEAYIIPNYGGVVASKPNCFELKVGNPFKNGPIEFKIHCINKVFTCVTQFDVNTLRESHSGTYGGGEHLPNDISEGAQPLMLVSAQFTGDEMRIYINTNLVASLNLVEQRILDNVSSDFFIGGRGGEFRGIIESVRIQRGETIPALQPFTVTDETIGLWDFNDEIDVPSLHFFANKNEASPSQGRDGTADHADEFDIPLVLLGYDFHNTNDNGYFRVYQRPEHQAGNDDDYTALEKIASYATGIELDDIRKQSWYSTNLDLNAFTFGSNTGTLDYLASNKIKHSTLNAVINQSGTDPTTGITKTTSGRLRDLEDDVDVGLASTADLDPMVNPIERIRIHTLDFANNQIICQSVHLTNDATASATVENHPKGQGFLYDHADGTPIWLVLGNADLVLDPGDKEKPDAFIGIPATLDTLVSGSGYSATTGASTSGGSGTGLTVDITGTGGIVSVAINTPGFGYKVGETINVTGGGGSGGSFNIATVSNTESFTRAKDTFTRAIFTQGQRFNDRSGNDNTAYFTSIQSRITGEIGTAPSSSIVPLPDPPKDNLLMWLPVNSLSGVADGATVTHLPDYSGNKFGVYTIGTWVYEAKSASFNNLPALKITSSDGALINIDTTDGESEEITHSSGASFTVFFMMHGQFSSSYNTDLIGENASTSKTFFGNASVNSEIFLTNNGTTTNVQTVYDGTLYTIENKAGLLSVTLNRSTLDATVHFNGRLVSTFTDKINADINFNDRLFTLFGRGVSSNTSTKTGSGSNMALQNTRLAEFLLYEKAMTDAERLEVQGYFMDKYGMI